MTSRSDRTRSINTIKKLVPQKNWNEVITVFRNRAITIGGMTVLPPTKETKRRRLQKRLEDTQKCQRLNRLSRKNLFKEGLSKIKVSLYFCSLCMMWLHFA